MPILRLFLCCLLISLWQPVASRAQVYNGVELVQAELLADTTAVAPGKPFTVGLRLKMAPHWHTYWQYSGDAGLPTSIKWTLPDGFKAGPIQWPVPEKIESAGDILNYGYSDEVVLLTEITPPSQFAGEAAIQARADWLVCADLCIPGHADLHLTLPGGAESAAANPEVFARHRARLPRKEGGVKVGQAAKLADNGDVVFTLQAGDVDQPPEFFPLPVGSAEIGHPKVAVKGASLEVRVPVLAEPKAAARFGGLLVVGQGELRVGHLVSAESLWKADLSTPVKTDTATPLAGGAGSAAGGGVWHFLPLMFLGGLLLNVMPCVLPVISLKIFSFIKQANDAPDRIFKLGLAYAAGVFAWFLGFAALVVVLKAGGREIGYSFHLQNPWFVVGLSAVVFVFSLNLLGVFEILLPGASSGALTGAAQRGGYTGAFLQGLLATVLGSACTAPFFGAALGFAFAQKAPLVFAMFAVLAFGMSLPFVLLTAFPAWLRFVPRPGVWMERVKQATGFLMLATLLWLLSVLGEMRGASAVVWLGVLLLALGMGCWVQGSFNTLVASGRTRLAAWTLTLALLAGGIWVCVPQIATARLPAAGGMSARDFPAQLKAALSEPGRPVFVDFTAAWCINCKANERLILNADPVQRALKSANANFLTADWTNGEPGITALLKQFGRAGVPLYVIYPADRTREPIVLPELLTTQLVLDGLKSASGGAQLAVAAAP